MTSESRQYGLAYAVFEYRLICGETEMTESVTLIPAGEVLCTLESLSDGAARIVQVRASEGLISVIVLRSGEQCFAYLNRCPHFGSPLSQTDAQLYHGPHEWLKCNIHYAVFRWSDGQCIKGECEGDALRAVPVLLRDGLVLVGP